MFKGLATSVIHKCDSRIREPFNTVTALICLYELVALISSRDEEGDLSVPPVSYAAFVFPPIGWMLAGILLWHWHASGKRYRETHSHLWFVGH